MLKSVEIEENVLDSLLIESIAKYTRMLRESKRDDLLLPYLELLNKRGNNVTLGQLKSFLLNKFATEFGIHSLSASSNFYLAGVARYYFEGYLTTNKRLNVFYPKFKDKPNTEICGKLDKLIEFLRNSYIDSVGTKFEQPEDFGTLTLEKLFKKYNKKVFGNNEIKPQEEGETNVTDGQVNKNYTYKIIYNFDEAKPYSQYTQPGAWCITYGRQYFNNYVKKLNIHYVFFLQNGFENVPRKVGKGYTQTKPHDAYGNSMIAVLQSNDSPEPIYITSRWNHGYRDTDGTEADHAYTKEEFLQVIGADESILQQCFEQWKKGIEQNKNSNSDVRKLKNQAKLNILRKFKYAQMMINGGADPKQFFYDYIPFNRQEGNKLGKNLFLICIKDENQLAWWSVMDRKQILFDKVCIESDYRPLLFNYNETTVGIFNNGNGHMMFYNKRRHKFIDLNGNFKFKYHDYSAKHENKRTKYIMVALRGNEIGLINIEKGEAVKAPNGATIFEAIVSCGNSRYRPSNVDYSGHIRLDDLSGDGIVRFIYDSSAKIEFPYSLQTDSFISAPRNVAQEGYTMSDETKKFAKIGCIVYDKDENSYTKNWFSRTYKIWNISNQDWFSIEDSDEFYSVDIFQDIFIYAIDPKKGEKYFNLDTNEYLNLNGQIVIGKRSQALDHQEWLYIQPISSERMWDCLLYSPQYNVFYKAPNGSYLVSVYGTDYYGRRCTIDIDKKRYTVPNPEEYVQQISNIQESINNKMKIMRLNEEQFQNLIVEELTKNEVISLIRDRIDSNLNSSDFKKKVKEISADIVSNLFKTLWQQNNMWKRACQQ